MQSYHVERLKINFKTLEEFKQFRDYGLAELSMLEDLEANLIENNSESPFYGIYLYGRLAARMCLYHIDAKYDRYFSPPQEYLELWKLEVLAPYQKQGLGFTLVSYAKKFGLPIKTNARNRSAQFWEKMGFQPVRYSPERDRGESPYVWLPENVSLLDEKKEK
jgi:GNAT superfamily N-acetyltransferase